jgi:hypothetical protein
VHLVVRDEDFETVPQQIRALGPWQKSWVLGRKCVAATPSA